MLAILVEGGGSDQTQFATGQHGLDHVAGIHGAFGGTGSDDGVQLVDEGDDLAFGVGDLLEDRLEALLELAPVLGPSHHGAQIERQEALVLEAVRDVTGDDAIGQALHDGRLADAGLADEHRVVFGPPGQDLDDPPDLLVAADDRVQLAAAGVGGEIPAVLLEGLVGLLGVGAGDPVAAAYLSQGPQQIFVGHPDQIGEGEEQMLHGQVLVAE